MKKKNKAVDDLTLYLPAPGFKIRYMPPSMLAIDPGDWRKQPLFLSSLKAGEPKEPTLFDLNKKGVI